MQSPPPSLEDLIRASSHALVIGVGGGGDVVGALAVARFLEFCGLKFALGGLSWERNVYDPIPGPRQLSEVRNVRVLHPFAWMANSESQTDTGVRFAESIMLAAFAELAARGHRTLWGVFGYGSDGELTPDEIEVALSKLAAAGGLLGAWALTPKIAAEIEEVIKTVPTEASAIPVKCFRGAWGDSAIRRGQRQVKLTPLTTLTFFMSPIKLYETLGRPAQAARGSSSLDQANDALHAVGIRTELDYEREYDQASRAK